MNKGKIAFFLTIPWLLWMPCSAANRGKLVFATWMVPGVEEKDAVMLARSLRAYGGDFSRNDLWIYVPRSLDGKIRKTTRQALADLAVEMIPFDVEADIQKFPYAAKVLEAADAESRAERGATFLAWMDPDTIFIHEPRVFCLAEDKVFAAPPVLLKGISSLADEPMDPFWQSLYRDCRVPPERVFPMITAVDAIRIRPHFNAGLLVVRPGKRILRAWRDRFLRLYQKPEYTAHYGDRRYSIFIHQAVLAATVLSRVGIAEIEVFDGRVNYSLVNHARYLPSARRGRINDLITVRSEFFWNDRQWRKQLPAEGTLHDWIVKAREAIEKD